MKYMFKKDFFENMVSLPNIEFIPEIEMNIYRELCLKCGIQFGVAFERICVEELHLHKNCTFCKCCEKCYEKCMEKGWKQNDNG